MKKFNFGENWKNYSDIFLDDTHYEEAKLSLNNLIGKDKISNKSFLDIGSGSGIFSIAARELGAKKVIGIDISKESVDTAIKNAERFGADVKFLQGSILDKDIVGHEKYDIVYSWGVLHHTGEMLKAIKNAAGLVKPEGLFVIAIYNKHWSSPFWKIIKYFYNISPGFLKKLLVYFFSIIIFLAKFLTTGKNPLKKRRGMSFYYDVIDWIGGYPYEYASKDKVVNYIEKLNFKLVKFVPAKIPTGCNEFVFIKIKR